MKKTYFFLVLLSLYATVTVCKEKKPWTLMIYMATNNDLDIFAIRNIKQMKAIGSNKNINILVCMYTEENNKIKAKQIFIKEQDSIVLNEKYNEAADVGNDENLSNFCIDIIKNYPAHHYGLIFWNHGTGPIEPLHKSKLQSSMLFSLSFKNYYRPTGAFIPFLRNIRHQRYSQKGICFDDKTGNFLTEQKLRKALKAIKQKGLLGKKIDLIAFDACLIIIGS